MPFLLVLPSAARPNIVSISCSNCSAGRTSQRKTSSSSPAFHHLWATWLDDDDVLCDGFDRLAADLRAERAADHLERLRLVRVDVRRGDDAAGGGAELDQHVLAIGLGRRLQERHLLLRDGVHQSVACLDHRCLLRSRLVRPLDALILRYRGPGRIGATPQGRHQVLPGRCLGDSRAVSAPSAPASWARDEIPSLR